MAKKMSQTANEKEAIQLDISLANMEKSLDSTNKYYVGEPLYDKTLENGNKWNIIVENESQKVYGTGWNFINKGTEINGYGNTQYSWVVNYTNGEVKQIDEKYTELSYKSGLAVTDGLIFNADSLNMSDTNTWGNGVNVYGFDDDDEQGGYKDNAFVFDGVNDYITIDGNLDIQNEITLEFYGSISKFGEKLDFVPFFAAYNGKYDAMSGLCMRMLSKQKKYIVTNFGYGVSCGNSNIWEAANGAEHNLAVKHKIQLNQNVMFTASYSYENSIYKFYVDGMVIQEAELDRVYWENFRDNDVPAIQYFQIGKATWNFSTEYFNGKMYSARIYNKVLNDTEVLENYNKTVALHNIDANK